MLTHRQLRHPVMWVELLHPGSLEGRGLAAVMSPIPIPRTMIPMTRMMRPATVMAVAVGPIPILVVGPIPIPHLAFLNVANKSIHRNLNNRHVISH